MNPSPFTLFFPSMLHTPSFFLSFAFGLGPSQSHRRIVLFLGQGRSAEILFNEIKSPRRQFVLVGGLILQDQNRMDRRKKERQGKKAAGRERREWLNKREQEGRACVLVARWPGQRAFHVTGACVRMHQEMRPQGRFSGFGRQAAVTGSAKWVPKTCSPTMFARNGQSLT